MSNSRIGGWLGHRKKFLAKAGVSLALLMTAMHYGQARFSIAYDVNPENCIADYNVFAVDWRNTDLERGAIYVFESRGVEPIFDDGVHIAKYLRGMPGDTVRIDENEHIYINGELIGDTLQYAHRLGREPADFFGEGVIPEGEYWFFGDTDVSFDSRYWGGVQKEQILGRAHGIY